MDPEIEKDLKSLTKSLHAINLSLRNRLLSILKDAKYVKEVKQKFPDYPLIPNDRCGRWYVDPIEYDGKWMPSYFKSTDGHTNEWSFSTRRLNLHILKQVRETKGILIVDSTRRGKKIPDSFSKTIPIWIAIMNKYIAPDKSYDELLFTPDDTVSNYERDRILERLPHFQSEMNKYKDLVIDNVVDPNENGLLRPYWVYPGCRRLEIEQGCLPVILVSASQRSLDGENKMESYTYVQGAGDDHELWGRGLTSQMFWGNINEFSDIYRMNDEEVDEMVSKIVKGDQNSVEVETFNEVFKAIVEISPTLHFGKVDKNLTVGEINANYDTMVILDSTFKLIEPSKKVHIFPLDSGSKKSAKELRTYLPQIIPLIKGRTLVACNDGEDMSVAVVLSYMNIHTPRSERSKETIRRSLISLLQYRKVNPQRATLTSVNSFLL